MNKYILLYLIPLALLSCTNKANLDNVEMKNGVLKEKNSEKPYTGIVERFGLDGKVLWSQEYSDGILNEKKSDTIFKFSDLKIVTNSDTVYNISYKGDVFPYTGMIIEEIPDNQTFKFIFNKGIIDREVSTPILSKTNSDNKSGIIYIPGEQKKLATGKIVAYHENGVIFGFNNIINGKYEGETCLFYKDGRPEELTIYKSGQETQKNSWWENGNKKTEEKYKEGVLDGNTITYDEEGSPTDTTVYKDGIPNKINGKYSATYCNDILCLEKITAELIFISNSSVQAKMFNNFMKVYSSQTGKYRIENNFVIVELSTETISFEFVQGGLKNQRGRIFTKRS